MDDMTKLPVTTAAIMLCKYCQPTHGLSSSPQKLLSRISPPGPISYPDGCCIQASVAMMKKPDIQEPRNTRNSDPQCAHAESRFSPKRKRPKNADSKKKEKTPSMARGWPMTPPVVRENCAQLVPNWNSIGMPVTTPIRKLIANIFAQKRAASL